jgi:hypothetical protein
MGNRRLHLTAKLQLGDDGTQWILFRYRKSTFSDWESRCFVRTRKALLLRCIRENWPDEEAQAEKAMAHLPDTFEEWRAHVMVDGEPPCQLPPYRATP